MGTCGAEVATKLVGWLVGWFVDFNSGFEPQIRKILARTILYHVRS